MVRIVLQARLSSTRLPGKCLLPVGGFPMVILAAKRASNTGLSVLIATSSEASDDILANTVKDYGFDVFRGPLEDVHGRFVAATEDLDDNAWIVRLTADNVFPDGRFIENLFEQAESEGLAYIGTYSPFDRLPYGMSAEVFRAGALRAVRNELSCSDREHVTPAIKRRFCANLFAPKVKEDLSHLRCTVDTFKDYQQLSRLFSVIDNPEQIDWLELCQRLAKLPNSPSFRIPFIEKTGRVLGRLTLGTAQLGLVNYGRTNLTGQPSKGKSVELIHCALKHGVTHLDCAQAYGDAEDRVGFALADGTEARIVTKLLPLSDLSEEASSTEISARVEARVLHSLRALRRPTLDVVMLHCWVHYTSHGGHIWETLLKLREEGLIAELGASVYHPNEAVEAFQDADIKHLQIPYNLLDRRWSNKAFKQFRSKRADVTVYGRSAFLQGVLLAPPEKWPVRKGFSPETVCEQLDRLVAELRRRNRADLCIAFAVGSPDIDTIVVGMETIDQLKANLDLIRAVPLSEEERDYVNEMLPSIPEWLLNPTEWLIP